MTARRRPRIRTLLELGLSILATVLAVVTMVWRDWIEMLFGVEPDGGSGALEIGVTVFLVALSVASLLLARRDWTRARPGIAQTDRAASR